MQGVKKAIEQLDWYFQKDSGIAAEDITKIAYRTLKEVLESQQPRVMTLEEAQAIDYVWYESRSTGCVFPASVCMSADTWHGDYTTDVQQIGYGGYKFVLDKEYGKAWRCWTSRPDEKVRAETPWQE